MIFGIEGTKHNRIFHDPTTLDMGAAGQFRDCLDQEFAVKGALMPDCHLGYTMPIGGVIATESALYPSWVGYDIGCGVLSMPTSFQIEDVRHYAKGIHAEIMKTVPVGKNKHEGDYYEDYPGASRLTDKGRSIYDLKGGSRHLGTLGGGNHFIEIGEGIQHGGVSITVHSGSRGIGYGIADHYIRMAHPERKAGQGSFPLREGTQIFEDYLQDMNFCLEFALSNRKAIASEVYNCIAKVVGYRTRASRRDDGIGVINKNHNHAEYDKESGLWVHRKGATQANKGMKGVIPGNMRDGCVITEGLGHPDSLNSSSHGAGRAYGRKAAKRLLSMSDFEKDMKNVLASNCSLDNIDESPRAYKNFGDVIEQQEGILFDIIEVVKPIINVKG